MAFPWNRGDAQDQVAPADARRRARGRRARQQEAQTERVNLTSDQRHQRIAWSVGAGLLVLVLGIVAFGFYNEFYKPPRVWAGSVREQEFKMGDLVERIRVLQGLSGRVDLSTVPFEYLRNLINAEVLRQAAPGLGFSLTDEDVNQVLRAQFYPQVPEGQQSNPGQLEEEFQNSYNIFLARTSLTDAEFRVIVKEQLALQQLGMMLGRTIPETAAHVEVEWIRSDIDGRSDVAAVRRRLGDEQGVGGEDFAKVASEVGASAGFADQQGYVGWVPKGAFPDLDAALFGNDERETEPLPVGEISGPLFTQDGVYIARKLSDPEDREFTFQMRNKLNGELVTKWQNYEQSKGADEGWLRMNFNSKWYSWVADQVALSAPRVAPGQQGAPRGPGGVPSQQGLPGGQGFPGGQR
jgi:parvulin-like peptidyl-prolyl isomerase